MTKVRNRLVSAGADPIEKKPLFHFLPGSVAFSVATMGCNFRCRFCQNWRISQHPRDAGSTGGRHVPPEEAVAAALDSGAASIAYTYTEPTIFFETCEDVGILARERGLRNVFVTNGYMTPEAVRRAAAFLDAANVDLKGFDDARHRRTCGAALKGVLEGLDALLEAGVWVEVTTLVVPGFNDSDAELGAIARHLAGLGRDIPWHVSRFHPDYRLGDVPPTPSRTIERACALGREAGLRYVYPGNLPGHDGESTRCPGCATMVLERSGFRLVRASLREGRCAACGTAVAGVFG